MDPDANANPTAAAAAAADEPSRPEAPWRLGVDVGGTFTDLVLADRHGRTWVAKVPSVPADPSQGVLAALDALAAELGIASTGLLEACSLFVHGSTVATNTMLEGKGAAVGLLTTAGFRDALEIRRGLREDQWDHRAPFAPVLVPRHLRCGVGGRIDAAGAELEPVDLDDVVAAAALFDDEGVEAVAVALLNSFLRDDHERAAAEALRAAAPNRWVTTSAAISPLMGEYERTSTAVVNATLGPRIVSYLEALDAELSRRGLAHPILMVQSNGGVASVTQLADRPVALLLSGPAAAVGALNYYRSAMDGAPGAPGEGAAADGTGNLISMEIGGTSCDVLLMSEGEVATRDELSIAGYHVSTPAIDIHTIGAGGGTIAGVDSAGMLYVGPEGAGADPGPACYGRGGTRPTVTDAQLVLGRLRPGAYAGGSLRLDLDAARRAIETHVAEPLGLSVEEAAAGIVALLEQNLLGAVEYISIERGHAPARFTLVAAGGAGPMHGESVARGLGVGRVYVPRAAGALCAVGMLHADLRQDFVRFLRGSIDAIDPTEVDEVLADLRAQAVAALEAEGVAAAEVGLRCELDLHHPGQLSSLKVAVSGGADGGEGAESEVAASEVGFEPAAVRAEFERDYQRLYGHVQDEGTIMIASARVVATASTGTLARSRAAGDGGAPEPVELRKVWHGAHGWCDTAVYAGGDLVAAGIDLDGPLLVEEQTTTVVVGPDASLAVDDAGNFVVTVGPDNAARAPVGALADGFDAAPDGAEGDGVEGDGVEGDGVEGDGVEGDGALDPIVLSLMQNRLDQISRHMGWVMTRTARSTIFSQSHDFSCFITTPDGTLAANADGLPIHTGGGGFAVRALLARWGDDIAPGDVFLLSDPYVAGGNHLPDWVIARPIFADGTLTGFCCNRAHQSDIGGGLAGTYNPEATEIWHEGIRLPVLKLIEGGRVRTDLWELLLINCRTPELLDGDLLAMIGSTRIGAERVLALVDDLGLDAYFAHLDGILDHAEARMAQAIAGLPDGTWVGSDVSDNDCFGPVEVEIRATVTVDGDRMRIDFTGSDPQIRGFKNSSLANTHSAAFLAVSSFFDTDIPRNEGTYRRVEIVAPEGTIVNARPPAPMTMNTVFVAHEIVHAVWKALAQADPERALAGWSKTVHGHVAGYDEAGATWVMYHWHAMGTPGATAERDGFPQMGHLITLGGLDLPNLEFHEQSFPVTYRCWELRCDAAGPGEHRGGTGVRYEADVDVDAVWSFRAEGLDTPSGYGVLGGSDGAVGQEWVEPADAGRDGERFVPPKYGVRHLGPARMIALTPGGGGWGDPFRRDPAAVLRDVRDGVVSARAAADHYGVVLTADGRAVDDAATARLRADEPG
jgi:N-methylhydantoinase A/oxoprolinase/acetone carboxylase beta subunit/N-methylhydantoinase B/oxoprolinase/acetone carboxylase alpha subunit